MNSTNPDKNRLGEANHKARIAALVAGLVGVIAYLPQCRYDFVYDDVFIIERNPAVMGGPWLDSLTKPYWPREIARDPLYRPMTTLSMRINFALFEDRPAGYRATNAALHGLCAALVAAVAVRLWRRESAGWIAGLLFAVHPLHAEAVAMVVGRAELLAALFGLILVYRHLGYLDGPRTPSVRHHLICAGLLALAVASKEHGVLFLPGVICLDIFARRAGAEPRRPLRERISRLVASHYLGLTLVVAAFLFARWWLFGGLTTLPPDFVSPLANPLTNASVPTTAATAAALLFLSVRLFVIPVGLSPIWSIGGFDLPGSFAWFDVVAGGLIAVATIVAAAATLRRRSPAAVPVCLAALFLLLPCHFIPAANWLFAERWLYLSSAFGVILVAGLSRFRPAILLSLPVVGLLFALNWQYQQCWQDTPTLMQETLARQPFNYHGLIGQAHEMKRQDELANGREFIDRLVERFPDSPRTWYYQALLMDQTGDSQAVLDAIDKYVQTAGPNPLPQELRDAYQRAKTAQSP